MRQLLESLGFHPTEKQIKQFELYYETLIEWNGKMNLTAITNNKEVNIKHFFDSLMLKKEFDLSKQSLLDVGSGAGFPSIPLKIMFPDLRVTIIDALDKRIKFLGHLCESLEIDVTLVHGRAEEYAKDNRESFDLVTARAVARMNILAELCIPFVKKDGYFVAYKNVSLEELEESKHAVLTLGGAFDRIVGYDLPEQMGSHALYIVKKTKQTERKYPRNFGKISKQPL